MQRCPLNGNKPSRPTNFASQEQTRVVGATCIRGVITHDHAPSLTSILYPEQERQEFPVHSKPPQNPLPEPTNHPPLMPSIPINMSLSSPPTKSKEAHLAAIREIELQEQRILKEIAEKRAERLTLQSVLDTLQQKPNGTGKR